MKYFGVPTCPYCKKRVNIIRTWSLKKQGEYQCPRCGGISNIYLSPLVYVIALLAVFSSGALYFFHKFVLDDADLSTVWQVFLPFAVFFFLSLFMVYLAKPVIKTVSRDQMNRRQRRDEKIAEQRRAQHTGKVFIDDGYTPQGNYHGGYNDAQNMPIAPPIAPAQPVSNYTQQFDNGYVQSYGPSYDAQPAQGQRPEQGRSPARMQQRQPAQQRPAQPRQTAAQRPAQRPAQRTSAPTYGEPVRRAVTNPNASGAEEVRSVQGRSPASEQGRSAARVQPTSRPVQNTRMQPVQHEVSHVEIPVEPVQRVQRAPASSEQPVRRTRSAPQNEAPTTASNDDFFAKYDDPEYIERRMREINGENQ